MRAQEQRGVDACGLAFDGLECAGTDSAVGHRRVELRTRHRRSGCRARNTSSRKLSVARHGGEPVEMPRVRRSRLPRLEVPVSRSSEQDPVWSPRIDGTAFDQQVGGARGFKLTDVTWSPRLTTSAISGLVMSARICFQPPGWFLPRLVGDGGKRHGTATYPGSAVCGTTKKSIASPAHHRRRRFEADLCRRSTPSPRNW